MNIILLPRKLFFNENFFIEVWLIYNIILVSRVQRSDLIFLLIILYNNFKWNIIGRKFFC